MKAESSGAILKKGVGNDSSQLSQVRIAAAYLANQRKISLKKCCDCGNEFEGIAIAKRCSACKIIAFEMMTKKSNARRAKLKEFGLSGAEILTLADKAATARDWLLSDELKTVEDIRNFDFSTLKQVANLGG